jgi:integration host factor subunit beta
MNKAEFIELFAEQNKISVKVSEAIVNSILETMVTALAQHIRIEIRGFGSFKIKEYKSYEGRNPKTGGNIKVKEKSVPFFKMSKICKNDLIKIKENV